MSITFCTNIGFGYITDELPSVFLDEEGIIKDDFESCGDSLLIVEPVGQGVYQNFIGLRNSFSSKDVYDCVVVRIPTEDTDTPLWFLVTELLTFGITPPRIDQVGWHSWISHR